MLSNFIVSAEAVMPMVVLMAIGVLVRKAGIVNREENKHFNRMVFVVFFPVMMFSNLYGTDLMEVVEWHIIAYAVGALAVIYLGAMLFVTRIEKSPKSRGAMIQAIYRSNFVIMGIPVVANFYGHGNMPVTAMLVSIIVPLYNVLAVITLEVFRGGKVRPGEILLGIIKNPLIIGGIAGIAAALTGFKMPAPLEGLMDEMAVVATPMALVILGISFDFSSVKRCGRNLVIAVVGKLVVVPAIFLPIAAMLGFRDVEFVTLLAMFAAPVAVSSYTMAESMDSDSQLAANSVIFSSIFSCFTMFIWIFIFKTLGYF